MSFTSDTKIFDSRNEHSVKCGCSHVVIIPKADRTICTRCGKWVYRNQKIAFEYKMKEMLKKESGEKK